MNQVNQKGFMPLLLVGFLVVIFICAVALFFVYKQGSSFLNINMLRPGGGTKACTLEAKLCPDGSAVGRTGPNCEFAPCPSITPTPSATPSGEPVVCTLDAKQCPDGSYVSRQGPNCEFAPCPGTSNTSNWKTYSITKYNFSLKYPNYADWNVKEMPAPAGYEGISYALSCSDCKSTDNMDSFIISTSKYKSIDEYLQNASLNKQDSPAITDRKNIKINGVEAIGAVNPGTCTNRTYQCERSTIQYFFVLNGQGFLINESFKDVYNYTKLIQFPQPNPDILSTLKFTN